MAVNQNDVGIQDRLAFVHSILKGVFSFEVHRNSF